MVAWYTHSATHQVTHLCICNASSATTCACSLYLCIPSKHDVSLLCAATFIVHDWNLRLTYKYREPIGRSTKKGRRRWRKLRGGKRKRNVKYTQLQSCGSQNSSHWQQQIFVYPFLLVFRTYPKSHFPLENAHSIFNRKTCDTCLPSHSRDKTNRCISGIGVVSKSDQHSVVRNISAITSNV